MSPKPRPKVKCYSIRTIVIQLAPQFAQFAITECRQPDQQAVFE